jgi:hypothetical protein
MRIQRNISFLLGRIETRRCMEFTDVEIANGAELGGGAGA